MSAIALVPGAVTLADWLAIYRGAAARLDRAWLPHVATSAAAVARIVAKGEPVYGINTGFGKLASVRIAAADLERLQRNIVLSHAAGVGEATPSAIVRLMMALKLASLGRGASGVRPETVALLAAMLVWSALVLSSLYGTDTAELGSIVLPETVSAALSQ